MSIVSSERAEELARLAATPLWRGTVDDLTTPQPIGPELPVALQEDEFCMRMMTAFDEVLAPVFLALDCWDSYLDPQLAPEDFVDWVASWVGVDIDETWTLQRRRDLIRQAVVLYRVRGTGAGLAAHVNLYAGVTPTIEESGGCSWSQVANTPLPGSAQPHLTVQLQVDDAASVNRTTVSRIVAASRPAHLPFQVDITAANTRPRRGAPSPAADAAAADGASDATAAAHDAPGAVDLPGSERIELAPQAPEVAEGLDDTAESPPPDGKESTD